jgi:hypothetical protein
MQGLLKAGVAAAALCHERGPGYMSLTWEKRKFKTQSAVSAGCVSLLIVAKSKSLESGPCGLCNAGFGVLNAPHHLACTPSPTFFLWESKWSESWESPRVCGAQVHSRPALTPRGTSLLLSACDVSGHTVSGSGQRGHGRPPVQ